MPRAGCSARTSPLRLSALLLGAFCAASGCSRRPAGFSASGASPAVSVDQEPRIELGYEACCRAGTAGGGLRPMSFGALELRPRGEVLEPASRQPAARLVIGALGDTREALPETLSQVEQLVQALRRGGATAVVVLGGLDTTFEGTRAVLQRISGVLPVVALPGDRESRSGWQAAMDALGARGADLTRGRGLVVPGGSMVGVPGYFLPHHLFAREQGCSYDAQDLDRLAALARRLPPPRLLLSHGPPRGQAPHSVDRAFGGINLGDPRLRALMESAQIRFGLFAHLHESAGHATTLDDRPVPEMVWSDSLLLNVGSADSVPHETLDGSWSGPTAALLELDGGRGRYRMLHLP